MKALTLIAGAMLAIIPVSAQTITGSLGMDDPTRSGGERYEQHTFTITETRQVVVRMESENFDTYLIVRSPSGVETSNDDYDGQSVSQVELWASEAGQWVVWATQYSADGTGEYSLDIDFGPAAQSQLVQGRLDYSDTTALKGEFFDTHSFDAAAEDQVIFELLSLGFDGYLVVTSPSGEVWRNDDAGSTSVSRVGPVAGAGKWRVDVTSNSPGETGAYDLRRILVPKVD